MGTKINELVKDTIKTISFENLLNKEIAIDAFNTIYQFLAIIRQKDGTPLKDYNGNGDIEEGIASEGYDIFNPVE